MEIGHSVAEIITIVQGFLVKCENLLDGRAKYGVTNPVTSLPYSGLYIG